MGNNRDSTVRVELLGQQFVLRGQEEPEHLHRVADYVKTKLAEVGAGTRSIGPTKVALLTALNIASEHLREREQTKDLHQEIDRKTRKLLSLIDEVIE